MIELKFRERKININQLYSHFASSKPDEGTRWMPFPLSQYACRIAFCRLFIYPEIYCDVFAGSFMFAFDIERGAVTVLLPLSVAK